MEQTKHKTDIKTIFVQRLNKICRIIDPLNEKGNKGFAIEIGTSEQNISHYRNGDRFPQNEQYLKIVNYFKKCIPNFDEDYLTGKSESMTKENEHLVSVLHMDEDIVNAIKPLKDYYDILTPILCDELIKQFLKDIKTLLSYVEKDIGNNLSYWHKLDRLVKKENVRKYLNDFKIEYYKNMNRNYNIFFDIIVDCLINSLNNKSVKTKYK